MDQFSFLHEYKSFLMVLTGIWGCVLGLSLWRKRKPIILPGKPLLILFVVLLLPSVVVYLLEAVRLKSLVLILVILAMYALLFLAITLIGDFIFLNISETRLRENLESTLRKHKVTFVEGATKGLLAPGVQTKGRSIITLEFPDIGASVRYLVNKKMRMGFLQFFKKSSIPNCSIVLNDLKDALRSEKVEPGLSSYYLMAAGAAFILMAIVRF